MPAFTDLDWPSLPGAAQRAAGIGAALRGFGYDCMELSDELTTAEMIGSTFYDAVESLNADDLLVVTVLSHGDMAEETGELYVVGSDGIRHRSTRVSDWIKEVEDLPNRPRTLFLLDLCQAGAAARAPYLLTPARGPRRSWVLAACPPGRAAYDGRFTEAVTNVLTAFSQGSREIHAAHPYLPLTTLAADSKRELGRLVDAADAYPQEAIGGLIDLTEAEESPPFFPNPAFRSGSLGEISRTADESFGAFMSEVDALVDPDHFGMQASGHGEEGAQLQSGCFTGRAAELQALSRWLDGLDTGALRVVTGSPGAGKSALLGVLVCAAHPRLRPHTQRLWFRAAHTPSEHECLAVVHARQRGNAEILGSIARQLDLGAVEDWPALGPALRRAPNTPLLIVDALDEALQPAALAQELLALVRVTSGEGTVPACRLLVGLRPWSDFDGLLSAARQAGGLVDLDGRPREQVRTEIRNYVEAMLSLSAPYDSRPYARAREAFAAAVAETLSRPQDEAADSRRQRWGEFLVAALFVHRLLAGHIWVADPGEAAEIGRMVPRTLPAVVDLDLAEDPDIRSLLETLATARGEGMPLEIIKAVLPLFGSADVRSALDRARFYLRQSADTDGTTLYRLFHQGLADHLRTADQDSAVLDLILPVTWDGAMPYLRRHAIQYAAAADRVDELLRVPDFLAHADPQTLVPELSAAGVGDTELAASIYRCSASRHRDLDASGRRQVLGVDAARYGSDQDAARLTEGFLWRPRWATGSQVSPALRLTIQAAEGTIHSLAGAVMAGRAVVVATAEGESPRVWDLSTGTLVRERLGAEVVTAVACSRVDGRDVAVTGDPLGAVRVWDLDSGRRLGPVLRGQTYEISCVACLESRDGPIAVACSENGVVRAWDLDKMAPLGALSMPKGALGRSVTCIESDGRVLVAAPADDRSVVVWELRSGREVVRTEVADSPQDISVARVTMDGRQTILVGCEDGIWLLEPGGSLRSLLSQGKETPLKAPIVGGGGSVAMVGCGDGLVHLIGLSPERPMLRSLSHGAQITTVACVMMPEVGSVAVTGGADGRLRVWDLMSSLRSGRPRPGHLSRISAMGAVGADLVLSGDERQTTLVHHLGSGDQAGMLPTGGKLLSVWRRTCRPHVALAGDTGDERQVRMWDLETFGEIRTAHPLIASGPVTALTTMRFGRDEVAVLGLRDGGLEIWELLTGTLRGRLAGDGPDPIVHLEACPGVSDRGIVASLSAAGQVRVWDLASTHMGGFAVGRGLEATAIACARVHRRPVVLTGHWDGRLRCWDLRTGDESGPALVGHESPIVTLACGRLGGDQIAASAARGAMVHIWDLVSRTLSDTIAMPEPTQFLAITSTGALVAAMNWEIVVFSAERFHGDGTYP